MNRKLTRVWVAVATAAVLCVVTPLAGATLVSTGQAIGQHVAEQDRVRVQVFLERADARQKLQALGVDALMAKERVAGLTDAEVHALAQKIAALPAGGNLSSTDIVIILLIAILVVLLI